LGLFYDVAQFFHQGGLAVAVGQGVVALGLAHLGQGAGGDALTLDLRVGGEAFDVLDPSEGMAGL
jgi:hypothetical protein